MARHRSQQTTAATVRVRNSTPAGSEIDSPEPSHADIAGLAYHLWEQAGCRDGAAEKDWLEAERILRKGEDPRSQAVRL